MSNMREYFEQMYRPELKWAGTHFLCNACLVHRPQENRSPDERYCMECYDFLVDEVNHMGMRGVTRRPDWMPREAPLQEENEKKVVPYVSGIMSPMNDEKSEVDIIKPAPPKKEVAKRGRKQRQLPIELIEQLHSQDMGSKAIASSLKARQGVVVSYKTIQRILKGERN
jgi:hypothetical protein